VTDGLAHSRFGASSAHRWMRCAGSVVLNERVPAQPSSRYAQEGTHAHALLAHCLKTGEDALAYVGKAYVDLPAETYEADMCEGVQTALDWVKELREEFPDAQGWSERSFVLPTQHAAGEVYGTCDIAIYVPSTTTLYVPDFKFGFRVVDPKDNPQLLHYGLGAMFAMDVPISRLMLGVIQPRAFGVAPIRWWETDVVGEWDFLAAMETRIYEALEADAEYGRTRLTLVDPWYKTWLTPGEDQCQWCAAGAAGICPAIEQKALQVVQTSFSAFKDVPTGTALPKPETIPLDKVAYILEHKPMVEAWLDSVQTYARTEALSGRQVPGQKIVEAISRRKWEGDPAKIAASLVEISGLPEAEFYEPKLKGITDVEKKLVRAAVERRAFQIAAKPTKAERDSVTVEVKNRMALLTLKQGSGSLSLVPVSDPRPAVNPAAVNFKGVIT
jgi:hypothetical protein